MQDRFYRDWIKGQDLTCFTVQVEETDLFIAADKNLKEEARNSVEKHRYSLKSYIERDSCFLDSLEPVKIDLRAPSIVKEMAYAASLAGVGPMAAVAGAFSDFVAKDLKPLTENIIVENGGDIYIKTTSSKTVAIYAGNSILSGRIGLKIKAQDMPCGVCTSSGKVGHSLSFGKADAVTVIAKSAVLADAFATAVGNMVKSSSDIENTIDCYSMIREILGIIIIIDDKIAFCGNIEIVKI
ncbi:MAG: UPF0280 family protein [Candidatus Omnitrophica bacterium]|nr:UPF0280 family protein [Candidatus Omnitrophota bacterium]